MDKKRAKWIQVRASEGEIRQLAEIAADNERTMSQQVREWIKRAHKRLKK